MSGSNRKPPPANGPNTRPPASPVNRSSPSRSSSSINGIGRSPSLQRTTGLSRPGRGTPNARSPQTSFLSTGTNASDDGGDDEARAEHNALMEQLRDRVQKAETASEEYQRQLNLLQARLEESQQEQGQLEDRVHQSNSTIEVLERDCAAAVRQRREVEDLFETERNAILQDKAEGQSRVEELLGVNRRLKESLSQREKRGSIDVSRELSRTNSGNELGHFAPSSSPPQSSGRDETEIVKVKDKVIQSLRLELAEAQIKIMELDSTGGSQVHELEKKLLETQITNARLTEDNESFQLLLSEKTLNGDFSKTEAMQQSSGLGSLAEELGNEELDSAEGKTDDARHLELENKSLKDQNKALALYIESIIGRLLQHKEFENILDKTPDLMSGAPKPPAANTDKELPPPPPPKDEAQPTGFLQRARSVVSGQAKRPRPISVMMPAAPPPLTSPPPTEDPLTAPSVPIVSRSQSVRGGMHKRTQSDVPNAAPIVDRMVRGPPSHGSGGPLSPGLSSTVTGSTRTSFMQSTRGTSAATRAPSASRKSQEGQPGSSSNSAFSDRSVGSDGVPRTSTGNTNYTGAVMTQNRLRPLRLVQENPAKEEDAAAIAARKKANRGSWMPTWMAQRTVSNENT